MASSPSGSTGATKPPVSKTAIFVSILTAFIFIGTIALFCLLAWDVFTIPYLTPFAHFLALIIAPFVPFIFPAHLGLFLKVVRYRAGQTSPVKPFGVRREWSAKKLWVLISTCWVFQHLARVMGDAEKLIYAGNQGSVPKGVGWNDLDVCSLDKCKGPWVELVATLLVVLLEMRGVKWEGGLLDKWVESLVNGSYAQDAQTDEMERMEEGESSVDGEKEGLVWGDEKLVQLDQKMAEDGEKKA